MPLSSFKKQPHLFKNTILWLLLLGALATACTPTPNAHPQQYQQQLGVWVANEGNFTFGNASLSFYQPDSQTIDNQVFFNANGFPVGDVLHSITLHQGLAYAVVNNSGKILVYDPETNQHQGTITGLTSPRYLCPISNTKAYATDLYDNSIHIIDLPSLSKTGLLPLGHSSESILRLGDYVFVSSWQAGNQIFKIYHPENKIIDSAVVGRQPNSMAFDAQGRLWVLSDGGFAGNPAGHDTATLTCLNPNTLETEATFSFDDRQTSPTNLTANPAADTLFFLKDGANQPGIYAMPVSSNRLPMVPWVSARGKNIYALGVHPTTGQVYATDAKDYQQRGDLLRYSRQGTLIDSVQVGIIPGGLSFWP